VHRVDPKSGYVYVATNKHIPGLVKIGYTTRSPRTRVRELSSATGVPGRFVVVKEVFLRDPARAERDIHHRLKKSRVKGSEFFRVSVEAAVRHLNDTAAQQHQLQEDPASFDDWYERCDPLGFYSGLTPEQLQAHLGEDLENWWNEREGQLRTVRDVAERLGTSYCDLVFDWRVCAPIAIAHAVTADSKTKAKKRAEELDGLWQECVEIHGARREVPESLKRAEVCEKTERNASGVGVFVWLSLAFLIYLAFGTGC
jgi:hypothetical protein